MKEKNGQGLRIILAAVFILLICIGSVQAEEFKPVDLPVIYIEISGGREETDKMNSSPDHSYRCSGMMDILVPENYPGPQENLRDLKIEYIRGRGNGTWNMSKNPYKIKLQDKTDLFGMGKSKTWVLLANYFDSSLIRNRLVSWLGEAVGLEYTPEGVFTEVVMNGEYLGNYYLCEQVQVNKYRVDIDELKEGDNDPPAIQGGYLIEFWPDDYESPSAFETEHGQMLGNMNPSFDPDEDDFVSEAQKQYIRNYIQKAENAVFSEDGKPGEYIDLTSLADYWWIMEFTMNEDAFRTDSAHMFKPRFESDGSEGKIHFGPLWDFDASLGNGQYVTSLEMGFNNTSMIWMNELRKKDEFLEVLRTRWDVLDSSLDLLTRNGGILDQTTAEIRDSWYRDNEKWRTSKEECGIEVPRNIEEESEHIRQWINLRREWIRQNLDKLGILTYQVVFRGENTEERNYSVPAYTGVDTYEYYMDEPSVEGKTFAGWALEDGSITEYFVIERDTVLTAVFSDP